MTRDALQRASPLRGMRRRDKSRTLIGVRIKDMTDLAT